MNSKPDEALRAQLSKIYRGMSKADRLFMSQAIREIKAMRHAPAKEAHHG